MGNNLSENGTHKFSKSLYGDEVKPKIGEKDIFQELGFSNNYGNELNKNSKYKSSKFKVS
jgi:hypothetical protein